MGCCFLHDFMCCCFPRRRRSALPPPPPSSKPQILQEPPPLSPLEILSRPHPLEEVINKNVVFLDNFIIVMDKFLDNLLTKRKEYKPILDFVRSSEAETSRTNSCSEWDSFAASGEEMLEFLNKQMMGEGSTATQLFNTGRAAVVILQNLANLHWVAGVLAVIAYVLDQIHQVSDNRVESIKLLKQMLRLASHVRTLHNYMPEEVMMIRNVIITIFEGSMMCASLLKHKKLFSFLRASVDSSRLSRLSSDIRFHYEDLMLTLAIKACISCKTGKLSRSNSNPESGSLIKAKDILL